MKSHKGKALFWNTRGEITCCSVPSKGSDTWTVEGWQEITPALLVKIQADDLDNMQNIKCECCGFSPMETEVE